MGSFFIEFRDPLFSIIILFAIIFVISFFSYWWGRYKTKDNYKYLDEFLQKFHKLPNENELREIIKKSNLSQKSWLFLAKTYINNGDFEKAIEIYSELLNIDKDKQNTKEIMFLLGKAYFKAGFLGRSRDVFLEILKKFPRTPQALHYLLLVYEQTREYNLALEVLEPLQELDEDISKEKLYLKVISLLNAYNIDEDLKKNELIFLYREEKQLHRMIFEYLFRVDPKLAWKEFDIGNSKELADIFWQLPKESCDFDIISQNDFLKELYTAKGYIKEAKKSDIFELDILIKLENKVDADIKFEYICDKCKVTYPFSFYRCSSCHEIDSVVLEYNLEKDHTKEISEESNSFL
jgi:tetratricopeptide (TPR) repeat protein